LFERYGVDLVLAGHEHDYERTVPIRESSNPSDRAVTYIVSGGGGAPLYPAGTDTWTAFSASIHSFVKVTVDACRLTTTAIGTDGVPFDSSSIDHCTAPSVTLTSPAPGTTVTAPATIAVSADASDPDGSVARVDFYAGTTLIGTSTAAPYSTTWTGVPAGSYSLTAVATDNVGAATTSAPVAITVQAAAPPPSNLPDGWSHADVGVTGAAGTTSFDAGAFTVTGAGADVWNTADAFQYVYRTLDGDGSIVARVASVQNVANWTKAGVMIRGSIDPASTQAFMLVSSAKGVAFQRRLTNGASSISTSGAASTAPRWVKLTRTGAVITAFESPDGVAWTTVGSNTFAMGSSVVVGLAVSSHVNGTLATAVFDTVSITAAVSPPANAPPTVTLTSPAPGTSATAPADITLTADAADSDGSVVKVDFFAGTTLVGTASASPYSFVWHGVPAGTYSLTAVATDNAGASTTSAAVSTTVSPASPPPSGLPDGWSHADVGVTGAAGTTAFSEGTFTVTGAGADVWNTSDAFQYVYRTLDGDGSIVARVASVQNVANWTKAGVMIRGSIDPSSAQAFMLVSWAKGVAFQRRLADAASSISTSGTPSTAPRWVKLTRTGAVITAFESADGMAWTTVGSDTFAIGSSVVVGLAVSSHVSGTLATAAFDSVSVTAAASTPANAPPTVTLTSPASGATAAAPASITLTADAADADGAIAKVEFFAGTTLIGTAISAPYAVTWSGVPAGTYSLTAVATDSAGASATSSPSTMTVTAPPPTTSLPSGWSDGDLGAVPVPGAASFDGTTFTVTGSGVDVWGTSDQFHYAYRALTGDATIVARVASVQAVAVWVKAGLMIRETLDADSAHAFMLVSSAKGVAFQRREAKGGISVNTAGTLSGAPRWIKLTRSGDVFSAFESADGAEWTLVGTDTIPMAPTVYVGLGVTSHTAQSAATCTFDHVVVQ
jgi:regulation of enolase protein 1 (concanavalin A-like superfamily)